MTFTTIRRILISSSVLLSVFCFTPRLYSAPSTPGAGAGVNTAYNRDIKGQKRTAFDMTHNEIFPPNVDGKLNYSKFYRSFTLFNAPAVVNEKPLTSGLLADFDNYVVAGPARPFSIGEVALLKNFVHNGGNLLVLLHISSPVALLTNAFGIIVSNFVISESNDTIKGRSQDFYVTRFATHPVTKDLEKVAVFGTWGLMADEGAVVVAETSNQAWADINRNRTFDHGEPEQSFGIVAVRSYGAGKVVVVADDAPFANAFIDIAGNSKLAGNIIRWFNSAPDIVTAR